ncbi:MAG: hypothetical protein ACREQW_21880 [Candidatus Binatia bacterium]
MPFEGRQRAAVLDRCWSIYISLTRAFILPEEFHVQFPVIVEPVLVSDALQVTVPIGGDLTLSLREEYAFDRHNLSVSRYSYNVIDANGGNLLRADNLPFHRTDYRRRALTHPPHRSLRSKRVEKNNTSRFSIQPVLGFSRAITSSPGSPESCSG